VTTEDQAAEPSFDQMAELRIELWAARDAVIGAEAAAGQLRGRVRALESQVDDGRRHVEALLIEVQELRRRIADLEDVQAHRDAMLRSPTWRIGAAVMRPVQAARRRQRG
jgi:predicted  nucleic acid-binding Zn-ribbon protein